MVLRFRFAFAEILCTDLVPFFGLKIIDQVVLQTEHKEINNK